MKLPKFALLTLSHALVAAFGFAGGIYALPILTAPPSPSSQELALASDGNLYQTEFQREREGSDLLHWGEGKVLLGPNYITFEGELSPGPDFKLYLSPEFVETEAEFERLKPKMLSVGEVKTFSNFVVELPPGTELAGYTSVIVWCESFGQFITSAQYQPSLAQ